MQRGQSILGVANGVRWEIYKVSFEGTGLFWGGDLSLSRLGMNCQSIFVNLGKSPNSSVLPPRGLKSISASFWCDTVAWQQVRVLRARCDCDDRGERTAWQICGCANRHTQPRHADVNTPLPRSDHFLTCFFQERGGLEGAISKLLRAVLTLNSTSVWEIDVGTLEQLYLWTSRCPSQLHGAIYDTFLIKGRRTRERVTQRGLGTSQGVQRWSFRGGLRHRGMTDLF